MPKIKCEVDKCAFNSNLTCLKNSIDIDGIDSRTKKDTSCSSFQPKVNEDYFFEIANIDSSSNHTEVYCDVVKCVFERGQRCQADRIVIKNVFNDKLNNTTTHCQTFESKD